MIAPRNPAAWPTLGCYLGLLLGVNLVWEILQLPLYTLWEEENVAFIAFAVAHCTGGDLLIGLAALAAAWVLCGARPWPQRRYREVAVTATLLGVAYTVFSEWHNTAVLASWRYAAQMPVLPVTGTGLAPLLQWIVLPPLAFWWAAPARSFYRKPEGRDRVATEQESP